MVGINNNNILISFSDLEKFQNLFNNFKVNKVIDEIEDFKRGSVFFLVYLLFKNKNSFLIISVENLFNTFIDFNNGLESNLQMSNEPKDSFDIIIDTSEGEVTSKYNLNDLQQFDLFNLLMDLRTNNNHWAFQVK